jgi:hypothetical protein
MNHGLWNRHEIGVGSLDHAAWFDETAPCRRQSRRSIVGARVDSLDHVSWFDDQA